MSIKALVIGNLGYVGCVLNKYLFERSVDVYGVDANWFGDDTLLNNQKKYTCSQIINDIRNNFNDDDIWSENFDAVIYLAAVSNDPMGKKFAHVTHRINAEYCIKIAKEAKNKELKNLFLLQVVVCMA